jgi:hypothetical protein
MNGNVRTPLCDLAFDLTGEKTLATDLGERASITVPFGRDGADFDLQRRMMSPEKVADYLNLSESELRAARRDY